MTVDGGYTMRAPCKCGCERGRLESRNGQACVYCAECGAHCYNAPKVETGTATRAVSTRPDIKPKQRARVLARDAHRCLTCGRPAGRVILHIGHVLSVDEGRALGATDVELYDDENLIAQCEECNLGTGSRSISPRLALLLIRAAIRRRELQGAA